ncbi:MAG: cytochrome P450 [Novosphingobium sp.]
MVDQREQVWLIAAHDQVVEVLKNNSLFRSSELLDSERDGVRGRLVDANMQRSDGADHARFRAVADSNAVAAALAPHRQWFEETVKAFWKGLTAKQGVDICELLIQPLAARLFARMAGLDEAAASALTDWSLALAAKDAPALTRTPYEKITMFMEMRRAFRKAAADGPPSWSLIAKIEAGCERGSLTREEADSFYALLVTAGVQTLASTFSGWVAAFAGQEALPEAAIPAAIEEMLRLCTPAAQFDRFVNVDTELGGASLKAGERIVVLLGAANLDHRVFIEPDRIDPGRRNIKSHLAFGTGRHFCLGARAAREAAFWFAMSSYPHLCRAKMRGSSFHGSAHVPGHSSLLIEVDS